MRFITVVFLLVTSFVYGQWTPYNVNMQVKGKLRADKQIYFPLNADSGKVWVCINDSTGLGEWRTVSGGGTVDTLTLPFYHSITGITDTSLSWNKLTGLKDTVEFHIQGYPISNNFWSLTGNAGTNPADNFLGTTDHRELYVKADTINVGTKYNSTSFNGLNTFTKDSTIYFNGIGIINDSATGASAIGEFAIFKAPDGSLDAVQIEFECNNGEGVEATLKVTPDVLSFGSYSFFTGNNNLSLDRSTGLYEMGIINGSIWMAIDSAADQFIFNGGSVKIVDGTEGDGKVLTSDATGLASWRTFIGTPIKDSIAATGATISPAINTTHVITSVGAITSAILDFPSGNTGDWIFVIFNKAVVTLTNSGTGSTLVSLVSPLLGTSKLYVNIGGNWY